MSGPPTSGSFQLHVYNGTEGYVYLQVFGAIGCEGPFVPVTDCIADDAVGFKVTVSPTEAYERYFIRIDLAASGPDEDYVPYDADQDNFVAVAAYEGKEPAFSNQMEYNSRENQQDGQDVVPPARLPVSCTGLTFHRLIFSSCDSKQDLEAWADEMGLPVSESYEGKGGAVVAADVPDGMSLQTIGGAARQQRPKQDTTGTSVEPDYIISLFNPDDPTNYFSGGLEQTSLKIEEIKNCLAFKPEAKSSKDKEQIIVTIIDSGVDYAPVNFDYWKQTLYQQPVSTAFIQSGQLGFDFIENDMEPDDQTPHGTFVSGAVVGGYRGRMPLTTVHFKIFGAQKAATYYGALVAIREAITIESDIINMSWGFYADETPAALQCLVEQARKQGIVMVTSAGNENEDISSNRQWPASFAATFPETVVSVASYEFENDDLDPSNVRRISFSNKGVPDVAVAAFMTTETPNYGTSGTGYFLGTSISTPIVTRTMANIVAEGGNGVSDLKQVYDSGPQLSGEVTDQNFLPVCLDVNMP